MLCANLKRSCVLSPMTHIMSKMSISVLCTKGMTKKDGPGLKETNTQKYIQTS